MPRKRVLLSLATAAAGMTLAAAGCGGDDNSGSPGGEASAGGAAVTIKTFMYEPSPLTVEAETTITFTNEDDILHTVTAGKRGMPSGDFDEDLDGAGTSAEVSFDQPGTVDYFCDIHQGMDGQVIVE